MAAEPLESDPLARFIAKNVAMTVAIAAAAAVAYKIMVVARGDLAVALSLVAAAPIPTILIASAVTATPIAAFAIMAILWFAATSNWFSGRGAWLTAFVAAGWTLVTIIFAPLVTSLLFAAAAAIFFSIATLLRRGMRRPDKLPLMPMMAIGLLAAIFAVPTMWVPPENIGVAEESPFVGYVVSRDSDWTVILQQEPRRIRLVPTEAVATREVCQLGTRAQSAVQILLGWHSEQPLCESVEATSSPGAASED